MRKVLHNWDTLKVLLLCATPACRLAGPLGREKACFLSLLLCTAIFTPTVKPTSSLQNGWMSWMLTIAFHFPDWELGLNPTVWLLCPRGNPSTLPLPQAVELWKEQAKNKILFLFFLNSTLRRLSKTWKKERNQANRNALLDKSI